MLAWIPSDRNVIHLQRQIEIEEYLVTQRYPVDHRSVLVPIRRHKRIAHDSGHAETTPLVEAKITGIGRRGGDDQSTTIAYAAVGDGYLNQTAPDTLTLPGLPPPPCS